LSKAAHSGPSVCLRARAPCPLRVSCPGADRALNCAASLQARACRSSCRYLRFRAPLGARQVMTPDDKLTHGPGRTVALPYFVPRIAFRMKSYEVHCEQKKLNCPCLSSAKLRSTDSVNPRAVREYAPAIGIYSRHRDRRYWPGTGNGIEDPVIKENWV